MRGRCLLTVVAVVAVALAASATRPAPASGDVLGVGCTIAAGVIPGGSGLCSSVTHAGLRVGGALAQGHVGAAVGTVVGAGAGVLARAAFGAVGPWAAAGAEAAVNELGKVISHTTEPQLTSAWFSRTYWRVAGLAVILTVPFLFAAAIQAILRSDPLLLVRSAFAHLPLALLAVQIAAPMTMLLLAASDQMGSLVAAASGDGAGRFIAAFATVAGGFGSSASSFFALVGALLIVVCALALTLELLLREAAVYVVVLMLPLAFAAMVWPARRALVVRSLELLVALILSKFVIVAVLALAFGALGELGRDGIGTALAGMALLMLAVLSPWALVRLLPMAEVAAGVEGMLHRPIKGVQDTLERAHRAQGGLEDLVARLGPTPAGDDSGASAEGDLQHRLPVSGENGGGADEDISAGPDAARDVPAGERTGMADPAAAGPDPVVAARPSRNATGATPAAPPPGASDPEAGGGRSLSTREGSPIPAGQRSTGMKERWRPPDSGLTLGPDEEVTTLPRPQEGFDDGEDTRPEPQPPQDGRL